MMASLKAIETCFGKFRKQKKRERQIIQLLGQIQLTFQMKFRNNNFLNL